MVSNERTAGILVKRSISRHERDKKGAALRLIFMCVFGAVQCPASNGAVPSTSTILAEGK
jgi:hypothetical protein